MILAIDFDGVLHDKDSPVPGRRMGPPIDGAVEAMQALRDAGHKLIVHTVWGGTSEGQRVISAWMDYYKVPFDQVTNLKPQADVYLDDRAVRFTTWQAFLEMLAQGVTLPDSFKTRVTELPEPVTGAATVTGETPALSYADECRRAFFGEP